MYRWIAIALIVLVAGCSKPDKKPVVPIKPVNPPRPFREDANIKADPTKPIDKPADKPAEPKKSSSLDKGKQFAGQKLGFDQQFPKLVLEQRAEGPVIVYDLQDTHKPFEIRFEGKMAEQAKHIKSGSRIRMDGVIKKVDEHGVTLGDGNITVLAADESSI